mmetsp:Transcript_86/g.225  ORF Transcript_86/g.225 Transcript_86/m.225 type:complete len:286 (-) Transcript_86:35-892(-)
MRHGVMTIIPHHDASRQPSVDAIQRKGHREGDFGCLHDAVQNVRAVGLWFGEIVQQGVQIEEDQEDGRHLGASAVEDGIIRHESVEEGVVGRRARHDVMEQEDGIGVFGDRDGDDEIPDLITQDGRALVVSGDGDFGGLFFGRRNGLAEDAVFDHGDIGVVRLLVIDVLLIFLAQTGTEMESIKSRQAHVAHGQEGRGLVGDEIGAVAQLRVGMQRQIMVVAVRACDGKEFGIPKIDADIDGRQESDAQDDAGLVRADGVGVGRGRGWFLLDCGRLLLGCCGRCR